MGSSLRQDDQGEDVDDDDEEEGDVVDDDVDEGGDERLLDHIVPLLDDGLALQKHRKDKLE